MGDPGIYYSNLPWPWLRVLLAVAFLAFSVWALWLSKRRRMSWAFAGLFLGVVVGWSLIQPSHDRPWRSEVAVMPRVFIDGDRVRITGFRNFDYRSRDDFTERYEEREVEISHLTGVDFFVSFWKIGPVSHTFVSFIFDNAPPVSISIETRPEVGEGFDPLASLSCTINIVRYANAVGRVGGFDFRHFLNGFIAGYLYNSDRLNSDLPFDELRRRSRINEAAEAAGNAEDFYQHIRASLPTIRP